MSERPIIFSTSMVRALLEGRKTQTRRLAWRHQAHQVGQSPAASPWQRVQPGYRLWVREAWKAVPACAYAHVPSALNPSDTGEVAVYRAGWDRSGGGVPWRPPIHMPRWASRITLRVTAVRVERLQDISGQAAIAEGLECLSKDQGRVPPRVRSWRWGLPGRDGLPGADDGGWPWTMWCIGHKPAFAALWDSLHGPDAWASNPEVVVMHFDVLHGNIDRFKAPPASSLETIRALPLPEPGALASAEGGGRAMSDAIIRHALDTAEQQPTTAGKIAAFLHCMPGPYSRWWRQIPPHEFSLAWLAHAVERDAKIDPLVGLLPAEAAPSARRAEKAEAARHD